jgi:hypothetical protein
VAVLYLKGEWICVKSLHLSIQWRIGKLKQFRTYEVHRMEDELPNRSERSLESQIFETASRKPRGQPLTPFPRCTDTLSPLYDFHHRSVFFRYKVIGNFKYSLSLLVARRNPPLSPIYKSEFKKPYHPSNSDQ